MRTKLLYLTIIIFAQLTFAQTTYVPDDNFEQHLINVGYDDVLDDYVLTSNINTITGLAVTGMDITDLTGIEGFTELLLLNCEYNQLTSLDLSQNIKLLILRSDNNQITGTLDLSQNIELYEVNCFQNSINTLILPPTTTLKIVNAHYNELTSIDVSQVLELTDLDLRVNQISGALDLTPNTLLRNLNVSVNLITSLTLPNSSSILNLSCGANQITSLDASQQSVLQSISCGYSPLLNALNVKNNNNNNIGLGFFATNNPQLNCIQVDDVDYSNANWTNIDSQSYFSEDCSNLSLDEFSESAVTIFPNPIIDELFISFKTSENVSYQIINLNGQLLLEGKFTSQNEIMDLSGFSTGVYFLRLYSAYHNIIKKIIKH